MLFQTLQDVLVRREEHLARFDDVLHGIFNSEGEKPLVGYVFPDRSTLDDMLSRLDLATDRSAPREPWVERGIRSLRGELEKVSVPSVPVPRKVEPSSVETVSADANDGTTGEMEVEDQPATPAQSPEGNEPSVPAEE